MSYLKKIILSAKELIITYILSYIIIIISCLLYHIFTKGNLEHFINTICSYILIIYYIIIIYYLYQKNKQKEPHLSKKSYFPLIYLGISVATFLNMIIFKLNPPTESKSQISVLTAFVSSGIIGPIYEELTFRYIFLNKLKSFNSSKKAILINSIIFALIHLSPVKIIYAFILGLTINIAYEKYKNILAPILIHIFANSIVLLLNEYNTYIFFLSIIGLLLSIKLNNINIQNKNTYFNI